MTLIRKHQSTDYLYCALDGTIPDTADVAYLDAAVDPNDDGTDWKTAIVVDSEAHPLWADALNTKLTGDYYIARLVGTYNGQGNNLDPIDLPVDSSKQNWLRLTKGDEQHVFTAPEMVSSE